jgi:DNA repair exonuclease SbcCD ATPase subunit
MGRWIKSLIIVLALIYGSFLLVQKAGLVEEMNFLTAGPCEQPIRYSLGQIDSRFAISPEEFKSLIAEAEGIWEKAAARNLFEYDAAAPFKINLIFDARQIQTLDSEKLKSDLQKLESEHDKLIQQFGSLQNAYQKKLADYNAQMAAYEKRLKKYNKDVKYWNERGGAPADAYANLEKERKKLKELANDLEKQRQTVNGLATETNQVVKEENLVVS